MNCRIFRTRMQYTLKLVNKPYNTRWEKTYNGQIKTFRTQSTTVWHVSENGGIIKYIWKGFTSQSWVSSEGMDLFVQILRFCTKRVVISTRTFQIPPFNNCPLLRTLVWGTVKQQAARRETKRSPPFSFLLFSSLEAATSSGSSPISMRWVEHCWGWTIDHKCLIHLYWLLYFTGVPPCNLWGPVRPVANMVRLVS